MRINPAGIQIYQQQTDTERLQRLNREQAQVKEADTAATPRTAEAKRSLSDISVPAGEHVSKDFLSDEERAALDMLFSRFANNSRFQSARHGVAPNEDVRPGQVIDIKV